MKIIKTITGLLLILSILSCSRVSYLTFRLEHQMISIDLDSKDLKISKYEINNQQFRKYLKESGDYHFKPDSTKWFTFNEEYSDKNLEKAYHWHPAFDRNPVVNITYEAAIGYCQWLTEKMQNESRRNQTIIRLPSSKEMEYLLKEKSDILISSYHEDYACEFKENLKYKNLDGSANLSADGGSFTIRENAYKLKGLNGILGNVSEMCEGNMIMGGNWDTFSDEVMEKKYYTLPDPRVGFRIVVETLKRR